VIPLLHDFTGQVVLVFGGGPVGARKARRFGREARVVVLSPAFADHEFRPGERDRRDPGAGVELVRAAPGPEDVGVWLDRARPALVVAATDDEAVNAAVAREARERGVLVNRADRSGERDAGSVVVPATVREDPVLVAVATGGSAPALSRYLRERLGEELEGTGEMATIVNEIREDLKGRGVPPEARRSAVRAVVRDAAVWKHLGSDTDKARRTAAGVVAGELGDST
jgi:precorrin-2 dehydrogenase/sirohydrochlorin ferrochelatase